MATTAVYATLVGTLVGVAPAPGRAKLAALAVAAGRGALVVTTAALGALHLVAAISLGRLSAPGSPLRVFTDGPGTLATTALPWVMVPSMLVPLWLLSHVVIAARLRALEPGPLAPAVAR